jgi:hypothetical protein
MTYIVGYEFLQLLFIILSFQGSTHYFVSLPNVYVDRKWNRNKCVARDRPHVLTVQLIKEARGKRSS